MKAINCFPDWNGLFEHYLFRANTLLIKLDEKSWFVKYVYIESKFRIDQLILDIYLKQDKLCIFGIYEFFNYIE